MIAQDFQAPDVPAPAVVREVLRVDGDVLTGRGRAAGHGEHVDAPVGQERVELAASHSGDVRFVVVIRGDWYIAAKIGKRSDAVEMMIAGKGGIGMLRENTL